MAPPTYRLEIPAAPDRVELVSAHLWATGALGVLQRADGVTAWFPSAGLQHTPLTVPEELSPRRQRWSVEEDRDWQAEWKSTIAPVRAGSTVIVPTWLAGTHTPREGDLTLVLDPGRAFGSGHHATTTLCLELLESIHDDTGLAGCRVADVGCGTGVLAIAAAARGARVEAVDIDPVAVRVTRENAARNDVRLTARTGSVDVLDVPADVVVANLVSDVIIALTDELLAATAGDLVVSGISRERGDEVLRTLQDAGGELVERRERDVWVAARLRRAGARHAGRHEGVAG